MFYIRKRHLPFKLSSDVSSDMSVDEIYAISNGIRKDLTPDVSEKQDFNEGKCSHLQNLGLALVYM